MGTEVGTFSISSICALAGQRHKLFLRLVSKLESQLWLEPYLLSCYASRANGGGGGGGRIVKNYQGLAVQNRALGPDYVPYVSVFLGSIIFFLFPV